MNVTWIDYDIIAHLAGSWANDVGNAAPDTFEHRFAQEMESRLDSLLVRMGAQLGDRPDDAEAWEHPKPPASRTRPQLVRDAAAPDRGPA